ncbi:MAG: nuclear transport factor 2 family protein [Isosphaeraceae bacterium]
MDFDAEQEGYMNLEHAERAEGSPDPDQLRILGLSEAILGAICSHDAGALEPILTPDFAFLGDSDRLDRSAFLEGVRSGEFVALESRFESIRVEILGPVAVAAGIQHVEVKLPDGIQGTSRAAFTDIFVKEGTAWRLRLAHSVELS